MVVTLFGITIVVKAVLAKAIFPIVVNPSGKVTPDNLLVINACEPIVFTLPGTVYCPVFPVGNATKVVSSSLNKTPSTLVNLGLFTAFILIKSRQLPNACSIVSTYVPKFIVSSAELANAFAPIAVTLYSLPSLVTVSGIVILVPVFVSTAAFSPSPTCTVPLLLPSGSVNTLNVA